MKESCQSPELENLIKPLQDAFQSITLTELDGLLADLQECLMVDRLFDGLKKIPALANMTQFPPVIQDALSQPAKNYFSDYVNGRHIGLRTMNLPFMLQLFQGSA